MNEWRKVQLSEIASFTTGKLNSNAAVENGEYPFFTCSPETLRIDNYAFEQEAILLAGNNAEGNFNIKYYNGRFNAYRNKGYAHNAKSKVLSPDDFKDIPKLEKEAMKELIDFALNTCRIIRYLITGSYGATEYANIDDIYGLMQLLQFGMYEQKKMEDCWRKGIKYHPPTVYESGD